MVYGDDEYIWPSGWRAVKILAVCAIAAIATVGLVIVVAVWSVTWVLPW